MKSAAADKTDLAAGPYGSREPPLPKGRGTALAVEGYISNLQYLTGGARKSFVCDDSRNIVYAKHNIICRKATSFSDRKRKRYLRLWRKMMFLPSVGNTTLWVGPPLRPYQFIIYQICTGGRKGLALRCSFLSRRRPPFVTS